MLNLQKVDDGVIFRVRVQPASGKNEIVGVKGDALKIKINAPPLKGKVNKALLDKYSLFTTIEMRHDILGHDWQQTGSLIGD